MHKLSKDTEIAEKTTKAILMQYRGEDEKEYRKTFSALQKEVLYLNGTLNLISDGLSEYKLLARREKRSLLPIVCEITSQLFGLITEADLKKHTQIYCKSCCQPAGNHACCA